MTFCNKFSRSSVFLPGNELENTQLYNDAIPYNDVCKDKGHNSALNWVGVKLVDGIWVDTVQKTSLNYSNFGEAYNKVSSPCGALEAPPSAKFWNDMPCEKHNLCFACFYETPVKFILRGLCTEDLLEAVFLPVPNPNNPSKYIFRY